MGWADTMGKKGEGSNSHVIIKPNSTVKLHILLDQGEEPVSYWGHFIRLAKGGRSVICPGRDICPACKKSDIRTKRSHAINVWDYDSKSVKVMEQGNSVMQQLKLIYDQYGSFDAIDVSIRRVGEGLNTQYLVMPMPRTEGPFTENYTKIDIAKMKQPTSVEKITQLLSGEDADTSFDPGTFGAEQAQATAPVGTGYVPTSTPPPLVVGGKSGSSVTIPFGKYKGKTMEEIAEIDMNYVKWCASNITDPIVKAAAQALAGGTAPKADVPSGPTSGSTIDATKAQLVSQAYAIINSDPRYKGQLPVVIDLMKKATATPVSPAGKMLLADYTVDELNTLLNLLK